jgi:hypothetical protein
MYGKYCSVNDDPIDWAIDRLCPDSEIGHTLSRLTVSYSSSKPEASGSIQEQESSPDPEFFRIPMVSGFLLVGWARHLFELREPAPLHLGPHRVWPLAIRADPDRASAYVGARLFEFLLVNPS